MPLYVKNNEVCALAAQAAAVLRVNKTEAIRRALIHELERAQAAPSLVAQAMDFVATLHNSGRAGRGTPADKAFIDGLYGDD